MDNLCGNLFLENFTDKIHSFIVNNGISVPVLVFSIFFAFVAIVTVGSFISNKRGKSKITLPTYWFFAIGTAISIILLFWVEYSSYDKFSMPFVSTIVSTVKVFTFGYDWRELKEVLTECGALDTTLYKLLVFLSATAPILTANTILVAFGEGFAIYKNKITVVSELHVFSELNEKSICLAEDIYHEKGIWPVKIIFANIDKEHLTDDKNGFIGRVKSINGLTTRKSVFEITSKLRRKKTKYYLISTDETSNIENCVALYEKIKMYEDEIYVFSTLDSSEVFIDAIPKKYIPVNSKNTIIKNGDHKNEVPYPTKIILINEAKMSTYNLLLRHPLYEGADKLGKKEMFIVVIGNSKTACEFVKASLWCGQMNTFSFKIKIIENGDMSDAFEREFGDLKEKAEKAGITLNYRFIKANIESSQLPVILEQQCADANYFLISTDNDELTMNISEMVRLSFLRRNRSDVNPVIIPIIGNMDYYHVAQNLNSNDKEIKCYPSGCYCDIYRKKYITQNAVIRLARVLNFVYNINELNDRFPNIDLFELFNDFDNKSDYEKYEFFSHWHGTVKGKTKYKNSKHKYLDELEKKFIEKLDTFDGMTEATKQSNIASVIHIFYKLRDVGLEVVLDKHDNSDEEDVYANQQNGPSVFRTKVALDKELSKTEMTEIFKDKTNESIFVEVEHNRWVVFHLISGWEVWDTSDIAAKERIEDERCKRKSPDKKLHVCIVKNAELPVLAEKLGEAKDFFYKKDCISIRLLELGLLECLNYCDNNPVETIFNSNNPLIDGKHILVEVSAHSDAQNNDTENLEKPENAGEEESLDDPDESNVNITDTTTQDDNDTVNV